MIEAYFYEDDGLSNIFQHSDHFFLTIEYNFNARRLQPVFLIDNHNTFLYLGMAASGMQQFQMSVPNSPKIFSCAIHSLNISVFVFCQMPITNKNNI